MLWAAILFVWELVGIDLEKARESEGYVGALIKSIKSPQAIPWALLIVVAYFLFKCTIEWHQCSKARRRTRASRIDYFSGWLASLMAGALYFGQTISHIQIADILQRPGKWAILLGFFVGVLLVVIAFAVWGLYSVGWNKEDWVMTPSTFLLMLLLLFGAPLFGIHVDWALLLIGIATSVVVFGTIGFVARIPWSRLTLIKRLRKRES